MGVRIDLASASISNRMSGLMRPPAIAIQTSSSRDCRAARVAKRPRSHALAADAPPAIRVIVNTATRIGSRLNTVSPLKKPVIGGKSGILIGTGNVGT